MSINLDQMTAVQNEQQGGILGHLMWFSVGKQLVKMDDLERGLVILGTCARQYSDNTLQLHKVKGGYRFYNTLPVSSCVFI